MENSLDGQNFFLNKDYYCFKINYKKKWDKREEN